MTRDLYFDTICAVGFNNLCIFPDGSVYPCHLLSSDEYKLAQIENGEIRIFENGLEKIDSCRKSRNPYCSKCWRRNFCRGCLGAIDIPNGCKNLIDRSRKSILTLIKLKKTDKWSDLLEWFYRKELIRDYREFIKIN